MKWTTLARSSAVVSLLVACTTADRQPSPGSDSAGATATGSSAKLPPPPAQPPSYDHSEGISIVSCVERRDSTSTYYYQLRNGPGGMIVNWQLGFSDDEPQDSASENDGGRLSVVPIGAHPLFGAGDDWLPIGAYTAPEHWRPEFARVEETRGFLIAWVVEAPSNELGLPPGVRLSGFSVTIPGADSAYLTGPWTVYHRAATKPMGNLIPMSCDSVRARPREGG